MLSRNCLPPVVLVVLLGLPLACGSEPPVATPTALTAIAPPPLDTMPPPSSTAVLSAAEADTATAPPSTVPATEPGTPLLTAPGTATAAPAGPQPVSDSDRAWIAQAITQTIALNTYHFTLTLDGGPNATASTEGDYVGPDRMYSKGTVQGVYRETLKIGTHTYQKDAQGTWQLSSRNPYTNPALNLSDVESRLVVAGVSDWFYAGRETLDGVAVDHFLARLNANSAGIDYGSFTLWRDIRTGHLYRALLESDSGNLGAAATALATTGANRPEPTLPPIERFYFEMTFTRANDPTLRVPNP